MPKFLNREEIYRILQRELPEDLYPDGPASAFFSTADMDATAQTLETNYNQQQIIYANTFPQTTDERIAAWEIKVFGKNSDVSLTLQEKIDRILARLRSERGINVQAIKDAINETVSGLDFEIVESCSGGCWLLDESELDISTVLCGSSQVDTTGNGLCGGDPADFGKTDEEWAIAQEEAYTYEVRIYTTVLTTEERNVLDEVLNETEPARSTHLIFDGLDPADKIDGGT